MNWDWIVIAIDDEISRLQKAKMLLSGVSGNPRHRGKVKQPGVATTVSRATSFNPAEFDI